MERGYLYQTPSNKAFYLLCTSKSIFVLQEKFGSTAPDAGIRDRLSDVEKAIPTIRECLHAFAEGGELCRRHLGYDAREMPKKGEFDYISETAPPFEVLKAKSVVLLLLCKAFSSEIESEEDEVVDLSLMEHQKKTVNSPKPN